MLPRPVLYLVGLGLLIVAGVSIFNVIQPSGRGSVHANIRLLRNAELLTLGPIPPKERERYTSMMKTWAVQQGFDASAVYVQDANVVFRGRLSKNLQGKRIIDLDLSSIPNLDGVELFISPLARVTTDARAVRRLTESTFQSTGGQLSASVVLPMEPFYHLGVTYIGLLALGSAFGGLVSKLGRPSEWTDSQFTLYTSIAYVPAIALLVMFTLGGYLPYLVLLMPPLAAYGLTMALITTLLVVPGIPLWRARYGRQDSLTPLPGWVAILILPPLLTTTTHLAFGLWIPIGMSIFWLIPLDGIVQALCLVGVSALAPVLLGASTWTHAPAGLFSRAWVVSSGKNGWANAFVMGMNSQRTNLYVTERLLQELTPHEVAAVLTHEHGHVVLGHLWKLPLIFLGLNLGLESLLLTIPMWSVIPVLNDYGVLLAPILVYLGILPVLMAVSRKFERAADTWACRQLGGEAIELANALSKIRQVNGNHANRWFRWWASHPSVEERISAIRSHALDTPAANRKWGYPSEQND